MKYLFFLAILPLSGFAQVETHGTNTGPNIVTVAPTTCTYGTSLEVLYNGVYSVCNSSGNYIALPGTGLGGTVTSVATTSPITGGPITNSGTIACASCVVASSPGAGIARFAGGTQAATSAELSGDAITSGSNVVTVKPGTLISTSGPVADPGGSSAFQFNNASGALTFSLPAGVVGLQRCYRNATGKSGVITIAVTTSNTIDLNGANGTTSTGTLVSGGALGDAVCLNSDATNHWYAWVNKGTWTNN